MEKLKWITAEYTIAELKPTGGVVTQRDVLERWKADNPNQEVMAHAGFKCNQQDWNSTVSMRIGVVDETNPADPSKPKSEPKSEPKLLQPGYDELKKKYDTLKNEKEILHDGYDRVVAGAHEDDKEFYELRKKYEKVKREEDSVRRLFSSVRDELDALEGRHAALVAAVSKDAQKFSAMLVENGILREVTAIIKNGSTLLSPGLNWECSLRSKKENELLENPATSYDYGFNRGISVCRANIIAAEDSADLADAEEVIKSDEDVKPFNAADFQDVDLTPVEDDPACLDKVETTDSNTVLTEATIKKACDQAEVVGPDEVKIAPLGQNSAGEYSGPHGSEHTGEDDGADETTTDAPDCNPKDCANCESHACDIDGPFSESAPTPDELVDAAIKVVESNVTGEPLLAPTKEITQEEAKRIMEKSEKYPGQYQV